MVSLLIPLGAVIILLFLARRFVRSRDSLQTYQTKRLHHSEDLLAFIHEDGKTFRAEDAMRPVVAGVRELVALRELSDCTIDDRGSFLLVQTSKVRFEVAWVLRTTQLTTATVVGQGGRLRRGHWELTVIDDSEPDLLTLRTKNNSSEPETTNELCDLMTRIDELLGGAKEG